MLYQPFVYYNYLPPQSYMYIIFLKYLSLASLSKLFNQCFVRTFLLESQLFMFISFIFHYTKKLIEKLIIYNGNFCDFNNGVPGCYIRMFYRYHKKVNTVITTTILAFLKKKTSRGLLLYRVPELIINMDICCAINIKL